MATTTSRRSFLKAGLIGTLALATTGGIYRAMHQAKPSSGFVFDDGARAILTAVVPVVLQDAIPITAVAIENAVMRVRDAITGLPLATQNEIQDLFGLLALGPTRRLLAGIPDDWPQAKPQDVAAFLQDWRLSRFAMLQSAYHALHDLVISAWYGHESSWAAIGYPGPIKELS